MEMRVALLNLGESPRIFHNRLNKPISVPVGKITIADLDGRVVQGLMHPVTPETLLVGDENMTIPAEVGGLIDLLAIVEFEDYESLLRRFLEVAPPNNLGPGMRPSRQQIRQLLRSMVEDWIAAHRDGSRPIHDDKDPRQLEDALKEQESRRQDPEPTHPFREEKERRAAGGELNGKPFTREAPPITPPAPRPPASRKHKTGAKQKRRTG
jgi:hypothetical protein